MLPRLALVALLRPVVAFVPITGLPWNNSDSPPARRDINDLFQEAGPQLDLFILALEELQARREDDENGYFQIAGIHGLPAKPYNEIPLPNPDESGYCMHNSIMFPTWHRLYLLLLETRLSLAASEIAAKYSRNDKEEYLQAAVSLRLPYWDWLDRGELPVVVTKENIRVYTPGGWKETANPLFTYNFRADDKDAGLTQTVRQPGVDGRSNHTAANIALSARHPLLLSVTHHDLMQTGIYNEFARMPSPFDPFDSNIEVLHNAIHNAAGGKGSQLSTTEFAAFDPLFWLHHANLDRVFAIWQVLNPTSTMVEEREMSGELVGLDTGLKPFRRENGNLWTSRQAWNWETLGYTYSELAHKQNDGHVRRVLGRNYWSKFAHEQTQT